VIALADNNSLQAAAVTSRSRLGALNLNGIYLLSLFQSKSEWTLSHVKTAPSNRYHL
jgi:hypothetical protein